MEENKLTKGVTFTVRAETVDELQEYLNALADRRAQKDKPESNRVPGLFDEPSRGHGLDILIRAEMGRDGEPYTYYGYVGTEGPVMGFRSDVKRFKGKTKGELLAKIAEFYA